MDERLRVAAYDQYDKLLVAVDCIIFGFEQGQLKLLLFKRKVAPLKNKWSLIGRFIKKSESIRQAASKVLKDNTGLTNIYLEQSFAFGQVSRDPGDRVISVVYYALIRINDYEKQLQEHLDSKWFDINALPPLILDHASMVEKAREQLILKTRRYPVSAALLPDKFTMPEIFRLYQAIYNRPLDDRNFRKKILSLKLLRKLDEKERSKSRKGAFLYEFDQERYAHFLREGYDFKI